MVLEWSWKLAVSTGFEVSAKEDEGCIVLSYVSVLPDNPPYPERFGGWLTKRVRLRFELGGWVKLTPGYDEMRTVPPNLFDFTAVPFQGGVESENISKWLEQFDAVWRETGKCPDPGAYIVMDSDWLAESGASRYGCKHFLLVGEEMYIEVLAKGLIVEEID